jgi:hypothetical protein
MSMRDKIAYTISKNITLEHGVFVGGFFDTADAIIAALPDMIEPPAWQDISTAPRDGTEILLFTSCHGVCQAGFQQGVWEDHWEFGPEYTGSVWVCCDDIFQIEVDEAPEGYLDGIATHWQPLPAPPTSEATQ